MSCRMKSKSGWLADGKPDLDLLEAHLHDGVEHPPLAGRVHRVDERLVAVAQVDRAPQRRLLMRWSGQVRSGSVERAERPVLVEGHPLRGHGFRGHQVFLVFSGRDGSRGKEKPPAMGRRSSGRAPRRGARLHKQEEVGGEGPGHVRASSRRVPHRVKAARVRTVIRRVVPHRAVLGAGRASPDGAIAARVLRRPRPAPVAPTPVRRRPRREPVTPTARPPTRPLTPRRPTRGAAAEARGSSRAGDVCPTSHPVKAKLASKIFHLPGIGDYDRTKPDRCYVDAGRGRGRRPAPAKR